MVLRLPWDGVIVAFSNATSVFFFYLLRSATQQAIIAATRVRLGTRTARSPSYLCAYEMRLIGLAWPVERTDFSQIPCILEAEEGQKLAGRTRFYLGIGHHV